jgi:hypothetical protein
MSKGLERNQSRSKQGSTLLGAGGMRDTCDTDIATLTQLLERAHSTIRNVQEQYTQKENELQYLKLELFMLEESMKSQETSNFFLTLEVMPGTTFEDAVSEAKQKARAYNLAGIRFTFNGTSFLIDANVKVTELVSKYRGKL